MDGPLEGWCGIVLWCRKPRVTDSHGEMGRYCTQLGGEAIGVEE